MGDVSSDPSDPWAARSYATPNAAVTVKANHMAEEAMNPTPDGAPDSRVSRAIIT